MSAKEIILKVKIDGANEELNKLNLLQEEINALALQKKALNEQQKALNDAIKAGTITEEEAAQQARDLAAAQVELNLVTKETKKEYSEAERALLNQGKAMDVAEGSIAQMRLELAKAQKEYINLSQAERENAAIGGVMQKNIKAQSDELKKLEKEIGITSRSVGDYGQAVVGILPMFGSFGQSLQAIIGNLGQIKQSIEGLRGSGAAFSSVINGGATATTKLGKAFQFLKVAIASTGIGLLVVAIGSLTAAVLATERGMDKLKSILIPIKETFKFLFEVIQNNGIAIFESLRKAINSPKEAIKGLIQSFKDAANGVGGILKNIKDVVVNSFVVLGLEIKKALSDVPLIGQSIDKAKLEKELKVAKEAIIKAGKELKGKVTPTSLIEGSKEAIKRGQEIAALQKRISETEVSLNEERERANLLIQEQREIIKDTDSTEKEKLIATKEAIRLLDERTKKDIAYLNDKLKLSKLQNFNDADEREARAELGKLNAQINETESIAIKEKLKLQKDANTIVKQNRAEAKKAAEDAKKAELEAQKEVEKNKIDSEKRQLDATVARYDAEIKELELNRQLEVVTTKETAEEKYLAELALQEKISALQMKRVTDMAAFELKEAERTNKELLEGKKIDQTEFDRLQLEAKAAYDTKIKEQELTSLVEKETLKNEKQKELDEAEADRKLELEKTQEEQKKQIKSAAIDAIDQAQNIVFQNQNRRIDAGLKREIDALNIKRTKGEISEAEFDKQKLELEKKAFERKKRLDIAQALINGALAVTRISADVPKGDYGIATGIMIAAQIVQTGAQVAAIASQKFAKGGLLVGASHANGGIKTPFGEMEGGEAVINKKSTRKYGSLLSAINQAEGGVPIPSTGGLSRFANGGVLSPLQSIAPSFDVEGMRESITQGVIDSIGAIRVVNVASETKSVNDRQNKIENFAAF